MTLLWIRDIALMFPMSELRLAPDLSSILTVTVATLGFSLWTIFSHCRSQWSGHNRYLVLADVLLASTPPA
jgi:hypothetical protein